MECPVSEVKKDWLTFEEVLEHYYVTEFALREATMFGLIDHQRLEVDGVSVRIVARASIISRYVRRSESAIDRAFAELANAIVAFDDLKPLGDVNRKSGKQRLEQEIHGEVGEKNGQPRVLRLPDIANGTTAGVAAAAIVALADVAWNAMFSQPRHADGVQRRSAEHRSPYPFSGTWRTDRGQLTFDDVGRAVFRDNTVFRFGTRETLLAFIVPSDYDHVTRRLSGKFEHRAHLLSKKVEYSTHFHVVFSPDFTAFQGALAAYYSEVPFAGKRLWI
jgi:hypothetical protein